MPFFWVQPQLQKPEFLSFFDLLFNPFSLVRDMKSLKEILFKSPKAEAAGTLVAGRPPGTVSGDESVGHIVMTRHTVIHYVVLPQVKCFLLGLRQKFGPSM